MASQFNLPLGFGTLDYSDWVRGLASAFIGGGASAVTSGIVVSLKDPAHYAPGTADFFQLVGSVFAMSGLVSAMTFLRQKPIPELKQVQNTTQTITKGDAPPTVIETKKETHIEPITPKGDA